MWLLISILLSALVLLYGGIDIAWLENALNRYSYYFIAALVLAWGATGLQLLTRFRSQIVEYLRTNTYAFLITLGLTAVIFFTVPVRFRVLSDETILLSVAKSMTYEQRVDCVTEGLWYYQNFNPTQRRVEKRPYLFPFVVQLLHQTIGYRIQNSFVLNFFSLWGIFLAVFLYSKSRAGLYGALSALALVAAQPIAMLAATSGGFETFSLLFLCVSFLSLRLFLTERSPLHFQFMLLSFLLLANTRYESIIFLIVAALGLLCARALRKCFLKPFTLASLSPLFLIPLFAQRMVMATKPGEFKGGAAWTNAFQLENITRSASAFWEYAFTLNGSFGYAGVLNWVALFGALYLLFEFIIKKVRGGPTGQQVDVLFHRIVFSSLFAWLTIVLSYESTVREQPMSGRFYLPLLCAMSVLPVFLMMKVRARIPSSPRYLLGLSLICFLIYHPVAMEDPIIRSRLIVHQDEFVRNFLRTVPESNIVVISERPVDLIVENYGAVSFRNANAKKSSLQSQYRNHLFQGMYVVQRVSYATKAPVPGQVLDPSYLLEPVAALQIAAHQFTQISKVKRPLN